MMAISITNLPAHR